MRLENTSHTDDGVICEAEKIRATVDCLVEIIASLDKRLTEAIELLDEHEIVHNL